MSIKASAGLAAILGLAWAVGGAAANAAPVPGTSGKVVLLSDIHFDPYADPTLVAALTKAPASQWKAILETSKVTTIAGYRSDSNYPLFQSVLTAAGNQSPSLVLIGGDFLAHRFEEKFDAAIKGATHAAFAEFAAKTIEFEATMIRMAFPSAQVIAAQGNNDSDCGDYYNQPGSPFQFTFSDAWNPAGTRGAAHVDKDLLGKGYYSVPLKSDPSLRVIVLNGNYWSNKYENHCASPVKDAKGNVQPVDSNAPGREELAWLRAELEGARARHEKVWLLNHLGVGIDIFRTLRSSSDYCAVRPVTFYPDGFGETFLALIREFHSEIAFSFTGHTHKNDVRLLGGDRDDAIPDIVMTSVTPYFSNNPAFAVATVDGASVLDLSVYAAADKMEGVPVADLNWKHEFDFNSTYHVKGLTADTLRSLTKKLGTPGADRDNYIKYFDSGSSVPEVTPKLWLPYVCGIENQDSASYQKCICPARKSG